MHPLSKMKLNENRSAPIISGKTDNVKLEYNHKLGENMNLIALKAIIGNSKRSLHVVLSVALSVALIYSSFAISDGFIIRITNLSEGFIVTDTYLIFESDSNLSESKIKKDTINSLSHELDLSTVIKTEVIAGSKRIVLWGMNYEGFTMVRSPRITGNPPIDLYDVMAGIDLAERYQIEQGSIIQVNTPQGVTSLYVTGVFSSRSHYDLGLITNLETAVKIRPEMRDYYSLIEVKTQDQQKIFKENNKANTVVLPSVALQDYLNGLSHEIQTDLYLISLIISFLTLISVSHIMYKIVSDSMSELKILRSLGVSKNGIIWLLVLNSVILSLIGAIIGLLLGNIITNTASITIFLFLKKTYLSVFFDLQLYLLCISIAIIVGTLGGIISVYIRRPNREIYGAVRSI
jgi:ABC-type lipoprotein release transport system permease subunit